MVLHEYDCWLFDLDGTLVDVEWRYVREVFDEVGDRLGREFTDREAEVLWHGLGGPRNALLRDRGVRVDAFWTAFDAVADPETRASETFLYDDALFVGDLDRPTALVTHCPPEVTSVVLREVGVADWFDAVVCCGEDTGWKPDPSPVETALGELGATGSRSVLAGDSAHDIGAAWNAGLDGVHVERHDPERRQQCVLGDYRVETLRELQVAADGGERSEASRTSKDERSESFGSERTAGPRASSDE